MDAVKRVVGQVLPSYMVPVGVDVDRWAPLNLGKLDRKALPAPDFSAVSGYVGPADEVEGCGGGVFAELLGVDRVSVAGVVLRCRW